MVGLVLDDNSRVSRLGRLLTLYEPLRDNLRNGTTWTKPHDAVPHLEIFAAARMRVVRR